jgi:hypothetical protein
MKPDELLEKLAELEHEQWAAWARAVAGEVSPQRRDRWQTSFVPYAELTEGAKEEDRLWARKVLDLLRRCGALAERGRGDES